MVVYVVTEGSYSDYHIDSIFSDRHKADIRAALLNTTNKDGAEVEEWEVDDIEIDTNQKIIDYAVIYYGPMNELYRNDVIRNITIEKGIESQIKFSNYDSIKINESSVFIVRADSIEKAKKIFYDKYAERMNNYLIELANNVSEE